MPDPPPSEHTPVPPAGPRTLTRHVVLIGLRASGKSTLARALTERWGVASLDLDEVILANEPDETITQVFERIGEAGFRALEVEALRTVLEQPACIVALGGGTPTAPGAADLLRDAQNAGRAYIVYLRNTPSVLRERLRSAGAGVHRPALLGDDPVSEIEAVFEARDPAYRALADMIEEGVMSVEEGVARAERWPIR